MFLRDFDPWKHLICWSSSISIEANLNIRDVTGFGHSNHYLAVKASRGNCKTTPPLEWFLSMDSP